MLGSIPIEGIGCYPRPDSGDQIQGFLMFLASEMRPPSRDPLLQAAWHFLDILDEAVHVLGEVRMIAVLLDGSDDICEVDVDLQSSTS